MKKLPLKKSILALVSTLLLVCSCANFSLHEYSSDDLLLKNINSEYVSFRELSGEQITLLHFWSTWCKTCEHELITLRNLNNQIQDNRFKIVSVALDSKIDDVKKVKNRHGLNFEMLTDSENKLKRLYKVKNVPQTLLLSSNLKPMKFTEPETQKTVSITNGPQSWDRMDTARYFKDLLGSLP